MIAEAIEDILLDHCTPAAVRAIEAGRSSAALWNAVVDAGFLELMLPESAGGAGLPLGDFFDVLIRLGRNAMPLPFAQSMAARAVVRPGTRLPGGMITFAPALRRSAEGAMICPLVPFGRVAEHVLATDGENLMLLPCAHAQRTAAPMHRSQVATLTWRDGRVAERLAGDASALGPMAAALHAALLAGAMGRVFEMCLQYSNERIQFGKSLGKFQVVQHQLSTMAEQVAAASMAAEAAFQGDARVPRLRAAAMAKARASEAVASVANTAHALHGAIGVTEEYDLQLLTRRLHEWRMAYGSEDHWNRIVGDQLLTGSANFVEFARTA